MKRKARAHRAAEMRTHVCINRYAFPVMTAAADGVPVERRNDKGETARKQ
jgi:hypothetical protein